MTPDLTPPVRRWPQTGRRTRVLMTADAVGGVWNFSLELAAGLQPHGIDVVLAVLGPAPSPAQRNAALRANLHLEHAPLRLEWMPEPWADVEAACAWLGELERRLDCDLVHLNGYSYARFPFVGPKLVVAHSCVLSWWDAVRGAPLPASWEDYRRAVSAGLSAAQLVVAPTRWMADELRRLYDFPGEPSVIHNGRTGDAHEPGTKRPCILGAGRIWDEAKNLRALARVSGDVPWPIQLAGPLSLAPTAEDPAREQGEAGPARPELLPDLFPELAGVELLGPLAPPDMARAYDAASIYALPALYEPFGLSVLEAALAGCALVLADIPSLRELWDDAAVFVDPHDDHALRTALVNLINRPARRQELGHNARDRAHLYSRDRMVSAYVQLYQCLLDGQPLPRSNLVRRLACVS